MAENVKPFRVMYKFWLNHSDPNENAIADTIQELKQKRSFVATIRDGIRLIQDLRQGKTNVLQELFPWVLDHTSPPPIETAIPQLTDGINAHFQRLESIIKEQNSVFPDRPLPAPRTLKPLQSSKTDNFELEITKAKSNEKPFFNLQLSGLGLGTIKIEELSTECLQYAIEMNKLSNQQNKTAEDILATRTNNKQIHKGPKAMNVPQFDAPTFDDLEEIEL